MFINFRGEDTHKSLVSHLYAALSSMGINTFLDDEKLKKGWPVHLVKREVRTFAR